MNERDQGSWRTESWHDHIDATIREDVRRHDRIIVRLDDIERKMDELRMSIPVLCVSLTELNNVLLGSRAALSFLFLCGKITATLGVIVAAVYAVKTWILKV